MDDRGGTTQRFAGALVCIALAVSGCATTSPSASMGASESAASTPTSEAAAPSATSEPSSTPGPTPAFEAPDGILPPGSRAVVTLDGLRIRSAPGLDAMVYDTLAADTMVEVGGWGPTVVDGIDWYWVVHPGAVLAGYAAAGSGEDRYLELLRPHCEAGEPDLAASCASPRGSGSRASAIVRSR